MVPAYNEESYLPALLESVRASIAEWAHTAAVEVIVANNSSTDRTVEIAVNAGVTVVNVPGRGIGAARNGGAAAARGEILCFVDADSRIHPLTFRAIAAAMESPGVGGGSTGVRPEHWSTPLRLMDAMTFPFRLLGIDSGVVFCRRTDFAAICGYRSDFLVAEDIDFMWRLRRHVRSQRKRLVRLSNVEAITSTRKFDKHGHWRFMAALARLGLHRVFSPQRFDREVRRYWYEDR
jgi:glycosyltransferase involved in cell wall biosynthesis